MTTTAIRLARALTGRDHVALCGYHGWHDWSIAPTPYNSGVPESARVLSHTFKYNEIDSLDSIFRQHKDQVAAVIMEPMRAEPPHNGFLEAIRERCTKHGTVLIFDEIVTGFRWANGGAQERFGVIPDLAIFSKGIANGFPLSALVGCRKFMEPLAKVHASLTYGGETLSLAAAKATLEKYRREPVIATIRSRGQRLIDGIVKLVNSNALNEIFLVGGDPALPFMLPREGCGFDESVIRTYFLQEMFERGFLVLGAHAISYAHTDVDIDRLLVAYAEMLPKLAAAIRETILPTLLKAAPPKHSTTNWR
jgi:glutamate-1-semialdehyde 2,1-aminomutase